MPLFLVAAVAQIKPTMDFQSALVLMTVVFKRRMKMVFLLLATLLLVKSPTRGRNENRFNQTSEYQTSDISLII